MTMRMKLPDPQGRRDARVVLKNIVSRVTGKVAAAATGLGEPHISKALSDKPDDRYLRDEHIDAILALATPSECADYWNARLKPYGYKTAPIEPRTWEDRARAYEDRLYRLGEVGAAIVDDERSKP